MIILVSSQLTKINIYSTKIFESLNELTLFQQPKTAGSITPANNLCLYLSQRKNWRDSYPNNNQKQRWQSKWIKQQNCQTKTDHFFIICSMVIEALSAFPLRFFSKNPTTTKKNRNKTERKEKDRIRNPPISTITHRNSNTTAIFTHTCTASTTGASIVLNGKCFIYEAARSKGAQCSASKNKPLSCVLFSVC